MADDLDEATRELLLRMALEDVQERQERVVGKAKMGAPRSDEELALEEHATELQYSLQLLLDAHFAHSISEAIDSDHAFIRDFEARERMEASDRGIAVRLSEREPAARPARQVPVPVPQQPGPAFPARNVNKIPVFVQRAIPRRDCVICMETITVQTYITAPCGHHYDLKCLVDLVHTATSDESSFPPRCCQRPIPTSDFLHLLPRQVRLPFERALAEFSVKPPNRVYCSNPVCSRFLGETKNKLVEPPIRCNHCDQKTCPRCRKSEHPLQRLCDRADESEEIQRLVKENKWQRCPDCRRIVELAHGCFHMTCICRAEFCYVCAVPWKNCECVQWEERNLYAEAERRVDAAAEIEREEGGGRIANPFLGTVLQRAAATRAREREIQQVVGRLRTNHECTHDWRKQNGGGNCGHCGNYLRLYLLSCRDCYMSVCVRCARNRL